MNTKTKILIALAILGIIAGIISAHIYGSAPKPPPPVYMTKNPFKNGVYANGIIEPVQASGESINIYPEVSGNVTKVFVKYGEFVKKGQPLFQVDDSVQAQTVKQLYHQMQADYTKYQELLHEPRPQVLAVSKAQVDYAKAQLAYAKSNYEKLLNSHKLNPKSVSKQDLDNAKNALKEAKENLKVAIKNYELTKAGAWSYDIKTQYQLYKADEHAYQSALELLKRYTVKAPVSGTVLELNVEKGDYVSPSGVYYTYTHSYATPIRLGQSPNGELQVRAFIDEILLAKLPPIKDLKAVMFIRGTNVSVPLKFVAVEPYVTPKIELSDQATERVDVRVLPVIFRFKKPKNVNLYPGQLVDIYLEGK
jgi:HlyD family secretion protein